MIKMQTRDLNNETATHALIGMVLLDPQLVHLAGDVLPDHIANTVDREVWRVCKELGAQGTPINSISIADALPVKLRPEFSRRDYISVTPVHGDIEQFAAQVIDAHTRRSMLLDAETLARLAYDTEKPPDESRAEVAGRLLRGGRVKALHEIDGVVTDNLSSLEDWMANPLEPGRVRGLSTGYRDLDTMTGGLQGGLMILAGRTSMGKTRAALNIALNLALNGGHILYLTFETMPHVLVDRMAADMSGLDVDNVRAGRLSQREHETWTKAQLQLKDLGFSFYDGSPRLPLVQSVVTRVSNTHDNLALVVIDNLGHVSSGKEKLYEDIGVVTKALLALGHRTNVPIMALHQINRGVEGRANKRPLMSDLRDSGNIEEDAEIVALLYRDEYYNDATETPHITEFTVAKNKWNGKLGVVNLFTPRIGRVKGVYRATY